MLDIIFKFYFKYHSITVVGLFVQFVAVCDWQFKVIESNPDLNTTEPFDSVDLSLYDNYYTRLITFSFFFVGPVPKTKFTMTLQ